MREGPDISRAAAMIGEPARAEMLLALIGGQALTLGEIARVAGTGLPTASAHASALIDAGLVAERKAGRHRYLRIASAEAAQAVEALLGFAASAGQTRLRPGPTDPALRQARVCYDHLAGEYGVRMHDSLIARGHLLATPDGLVPTDAGRAFLRDFGVALPDSPPAAARRAATGRGCLDWSVRRDHLAGPLGKALLTAILAKGWAHRPAGSRALVFTPEGRRGYALAFPAADRCETATNPLDAMPLSP